MTKYVVGFAIWRNNVLLLHKKKGPSYVVGKLNGIGGKIEENEGVISAMAREFEEETGVETWPTLWNYRGVMYGNANEGNDYELHLLYTFLPDTSEFENIKNPEPTGEDLKWIPLDTFQEQDIVENLSWLIPLCLDRTTPFLKIYED